MSEPPPGYNPEVSLFQGGDAKIHAVQGGGGSSEAAVGQSEAAVGQSEAAVGQSEAVVGQSEAAVGQSEAAVDQSPNTANEEDTTPIIDGGALTGLDESGKVADLPTGDELAIVLGVPTNGYGKPISVDEAHHVMATATPEEKEIAKQAVFEVQQRLQTDPPTAEEIAGIQSGGTALSPAQQQNLIATAAIAAIIKKRREAGENTLPDEVQAAHDKVMGKVRAGPRPTDTVNDSVVTAELINIGGPSTINMLTSIKPQKIDKYVNEIKQRAAGYMKESNTTWNALVYRNTGSQQAAPSKPIIKEGTGIQLNLFSQLLYILPMNTAAIVVVPPINGDFKKFSSVYDTLKLKGILEDKNPDPVFKQSPKIKIQQYTTIIFSSPFYGPNFIANESLLLAFLRMKAHSPRQVFALSDPTESGYAMAVQLTRKYSSSQVLLTMLEPSYIVYPHKRGKVEGICIINASEGGIPPTADDKLYTQLKNYTTTTNMHRQKTATIVYKIKGGQSQVEGYLQILSDTEGQTKMEAGEITPNGKSQDPTKLIRLQLQTAGEKIAGKNTLLFVHSLEANDDPREVKQRTIELNGNYYDVRIADPYHNNVFDNWVNKLYTQDEAKLLNEMNLRPYLLPNIFPATPWTEHLAHFLQNIGLSNCFTDETIMTRRECQKSRDFISAVVEYYAKNAITSESIVMIENQAKSEQETILQKQIETQLSRDIPQIDTANLGDVAPAEQKEHKIHSYMTNVVSNKNYYIVTIVNTKTNKTQIKRFEFDIGKTGPEAQAAINEKLTELRQKNPDYIFI
jgi:hypothetical protein